MLIKANMWDDRTVEMHLVATVVLRIWFIHMNRIWIQDDQTLLDDLINLGNFLTVLCFWTIHRLWDHVRRTFHPGHKCHSPHYHGPCLSIRSYLGDSYVKLSHPSANHTLYNTQHNHFFSNISNFMKKHKIFYDHEIHRLSWMQETFLRVI